MALWDLGVELETRSPGSGGCLMLGGSIGCWALTGGGGGFKSNFHNFLSNHLLFVARSGFS